MRIPLTEKRMPVVVAAYRAVRLLPAFVGFLLPEPFFGDLMYLKILQSVACPRYVAPLGSVVECDKTTGKELLALRDVFDRPVAEVTSSPADIKRARPLHMCDNAEEKTWGLDDE
jgi:hypothetical protein